jgi:hypothetical protein
MPEDPHSRNPQSWLDRPQELKELFTQNHLWFQQEHKKLLAAQASLAEHLRQLEAEIGRLPRKRPPQP